jgi:ACT domain-containing protein
MKEKIKKISSKFNGNMIDTEVISTLGIARNTYYKYIKEIKGGN